MASADFLTINLVWATAAIFMAPALSVRPPRVRTHSFSPPTCRIYPWGFRVIMGLQSVLLPYPSRIGLMRFLFVRSEICLHLPSDSTSRCRFWCSAMTYSNSLRTCILKSAPMPGAQKHRMEWFIHAVPPEPKAGLIFNWWRWGESNPCPKALPCNFLRVHPTYFISGHHRLLAG